MTASYDVAIIGAGLAGLIAALSLAGANKRIALIGPSRPVTDDRRTTALLGGSIGHLERLGVWRQVAGNAQPLTTMRIVDDTNRLFRAPEVAFRTAEIGLSEFGYNVENTDLLTTLEHAVVANGDIVRHETSLKEIAQSDAGIGLTLSNGTLTKATTLVGADGARSPVRNWAGIKVRRWQYPQVAVVLTFEHELPHGGQSTEFHTRSGPFTQVPLLGNRSSLVWVLRPAEAEHVLNLSEVEITHQVERRMGSMLGKVSHINGLQTYPLSGLIAQKFAEGPVYLIGEAAHQFPPIGAQGLNLSIRDAIALGDVLAHVANPGNGEAERYHRQRFGDITGRIGAVDLVNRSLLAGFLPLDLIRSSGLHALSAFPSLRRFAMRQGLGLGFGHRPASHV